MTPPNPSRCVVLVPVGHHIEPRCEEGLRQLEARGYSVRRTFGFSAIDVARNQMASDALADGFEELVWIDADIVFRPDDVDRLRGHGLPLVAGVYPKRGRREMACAFLKGTTTVRFGQEGGVIEVMYAGFGFTYTHRVVFDRMFAQLEMPICNEQFGRALVPFFAPAVVKDAAHGGWWYLAEDYAFCMRARKIGVPVMADTTVRLWHMGGYPYGWEDAGGPAPRYRTYEYTVAGPGPKPGEAPGGPSDDPPLLGGVEVGPPPPPVTESSPVPTPPGTRHGGRPA